MSSNEGVDTSLYTSADSARQALEKSFWRLVMSPLLLFLGCWILAWLDSGLRRYGRGRVIEDLAGSGVQETHYVPVSGFFMGVLTTLGYVLVIAAIICFGMGLKVFLDAVDLWRAHAKARDMAMTRALGALQAGLVVTEAQPARRDPELEPEEPPSLRIAPPGIVLKSE